MHRKVQTYKKVVVKSPIGRYAKIRESNLHLLPKDWEVMPKHNLRLYNASGGLQEKAKGLIEIKHKGTIKDLSNPIYYDYGMMIGKIVGR